MATITFFVKGTGNSAEVDEAIRAALAEGRAAAQAGVFKFFYYKEYSLWRVNDPSRVADSAENPFAVPSRFMEAGLAVVKVIYECNDMPYVPALIPYLGLYETAKLPPYSMADARLFRDCSAFVDYVPGRTELAVRMRLTAPLLLAMGYYAALRSHRIVPSTWLQEPPGGLESGYAPA